jgi:hypothetical protein
MSTVSSKFKFIKRNNCSLLFQHRKTKLASIFTLAKTIDKCVVQLSHCKLKPAKQKGKTLSKLKTLYCWLTREPGFLTFLKDPVLCETALTSSNQGSNSK